MVSQLLTGDSAASSCGGCVGCGLNLSKRMRPPLWEGRLTHTCVLACGLRGPILGFPCSTRTWVGEIREVCICVCACAYFAVPMFVDVCL